MHNFNRPTQDVLESRFNKLRKLLNLLLRENIIIPVPQQPKDGDVPKLKAMCAELEV